jgi:hypothetical protein
MSRSLKVLIAVGVLAAALLITTYLISHRHDEDLRREMQAKAQVLKDEIDHRFPIGTPKSEVMAFLRTRPEWNQIENNYIDWEYSLLVGREPSPVWYCGPFDVGVRVKFRDSRLAEVRTYEWGLDCP